LSRVLNGLDRYPWPPQLAVVAKNRCTSLRFWTYVIEAVRTQQPAIGNDALPMLRVPRVDIVAEVLPALCAELTALSSQIVLVLDDYHLITNFDIDECLVFFVDHFSPE